MKCPACGGFLRPQDYEGFSINQCRICEGHWLKESVLEEIKRCPREKFSAADIAKMKILREYKVVEGEQQSGRVCPACAKPLNSFHYQNVPGLVVQKCPAGCGLWLDKGKIVKIQILEEHKNGKGSSQKGR
jgi:Zn-finger nucleic acid-binding protein